ncbi:MAG TPA: flavin reductase family protein [Candidatus Corynebacterium avicola]|uniref:Flavin reductase family protein n=1 Tax=Candidatus Corynebacterium avicola TaxID=2838527 RepID=A0A9D1RN56_9CORY|nr:flavin reductase family protein [Candidatus Corynebacterium avicola]
MASEDPTADNFRTAFRRHPTGVALITANVDGADVGITVSSIASLAVDPPAVSFSLTKTDGSAGAILEADSYLIHFLSEEQADVAYQFSRSAGIRFSEEQGWSRADSGEPLLPDALAVMRAHTVDTLRVGPSTLIAAEVTSVARGADGHSDATAAADIAGPAPLMFRSHQFYRFPTEQPPL